VAAWEEETSQEPSQELLNAALLCNRADFLRRSIEQALVTFANAIQTLFQNAENIDCGDYPFDYHLKRMSTVHTSEHGLLLFVRATKWSWSCA